MAETLLEFTINPTIEHSLSVAKTKTILHKVNHDLKKKKKKQKVVSQMKGQGKTPEKHLNEVEIGKLSEKEFRIMILKMIQDLRKGMEAKTEKMQD